MKIDFNRTCREVFNELPNEILGEILGEIVAAGFDMRKELRIMSPEFLSKYFADVFKNYFNTPATTAMKEEQQTYLLKKLEEFENGMA